MLVSHGGLHIPMPHHFHHSFEIAGSCGNHRSKIVTPAIENQVFRQACLFASFREMLGDGSQIGKFCPLPSRREHPPFLFLDTLGITAATTQNFENSFAHRDGSPSLRYLAIRNKNAPGLPVDVFDSYAIEFASVP